MLWRLLGETASLTTAAPRCPEAPGGWDLLCVGLHPKQFKTDSRSQCCVRYPFLYCRKYKIHCSEVPSFLVGEL